MTGNLTLSSPSSVTIQLGGPTSSLFGTLSVSGTATLTGALDVTRVNDFLPSQAETFSFLTAGIESGQFASVVNLTPIDGYTYSASYVPSGTASIVVGTIPSIEAVAQLFYNNSKFDANTPGVSTSDDGAIAPDKVAYLPGAGTATSVNVSSYNKGINGIMVNLEAPGNHSSISLANILNDFTFKVGNNNTPSTWATAPSPISVSVRAGAGVGGSDRVELIWADNAIKETWLEVIVKANSDTGLAQEAGEPTGVGDVFFFGNASADDFNGETTIAFTNATDDLDARAHAGVATITNIYDYNKDGFVNASDSLAARTTGSIRFIKIANPPSAGCRSERELECGAGSRGGFRASERCRWWQHRHCIGAHRLGDDERVERSATGLDRQPLQQHQPEHWHRGDDHRRPGQGGRRQRPGGQAGQNHPHRRRQSRRRPKPRRHPARQRAGGTRAAVIGWHHSQSRTRNSLARYATTPPVQSLTAMNNQQPLMNN